MMIIQAHTQTYSVVAKKEKEVTDPTKQVGLGSL